MPLNDGYTYREQLGPRARGQTVLGYLCARYSHSSAEDWSARLGRGEVLLDGRTARGEEVLRPGQHLTWHRPPWEEAPVPLHYTLVHEDAALLAVIKPGGLPTLPGGNFLQHTLLHLVRARFPEASPVHRLGRATSGLVLFARTHAAAAQLSGGLRERTLEKRYRALASGVAAQEGYEIRTAIGTVPHPRLGSVYAASPGGKPSHSTARVLERRQGQTLFQVDIHTGRPDQIRIHLASIGHPLVGDALYAAGGLPYPDEPALPGEGGYLLHAERLRLVHPLSGVPLQLHAPPPPPLRMRGEA